MTVVLTVANGVSMGYYSVYSLFPFAL